MYNNECADHTAASDKAKEMCQDSACPENLHSATAVPYAGVVL